MSQDFIKVARNYSTKKYKIEIYFSDINSTVNIELNESEFVNLIFQSAKIYNRETFSEKINFNTEQIEKIIELKRLEELESFAKKFQDLKQKPHASTIIFISDKYVSLKDSETITNACGDFMEALGFELETEDEPVFGSFFKKLKYIFSTTIGTEDLNLLYNKGKKALELKYVELPTAEQTEKLAIAAEKLVESLSGVEEGVIRCGALIVLKKMIDGKIKLIIQQLSTEMIIILDKNPQLLFNVNTIYELLTGDVKRNIDDQNSQSLTLIK